MSYILLTGGVGACDGTCVGVVVGTCVGACNGEIVGACVGVVVGACVGEIVGACVGDPPSNDGTMVNNANIERGKWEVGSLGLDGFMRNTLMKHFRNVWISLHCCTYRILYFHTWY